MPNLEKIKEQCEVENEGSLALVPFAIGALFGSVLAKNYPLAAGAGITFFASHAFHARQFNKCVEKASSIEKDLEAPSSKR